MRKALLIFASVIVVVIGGLLIYAVVNLNSIIDSNRTLILGRLSTSLDRPVTVGDIKASVGWGVAIEVDDLRIAEDPAFSQEPFVAANKITIDVEFLPLLHGKAKLKQLHLIEPQIHVIRNAAGVLNLSTIGGRGESNSPPGRSALAALYVKALTIENATVVYEDLAEPDSKPIQLDKIDLDIAKLSGLRPFEIELKLAILSDDQNVEVSGKVGPLLHAAILNTNAIPVDLKVAANSISLDRIRQLADVGSRIPAQLSISAPFNVAASVTGTPDDLAFTANVDLTPQEVKWADLFRKPENTVLAFEGAAARNGGAITVSKAELRIAALKADASDVSIGGSAPPSAEVETNEFNLGTIARLFPAAAHYDAEGTAKVVADVRLVNGKPDGSGTITLQKVALRSGSSIPPVSDLTGKVTVDRGRIRLEPTTFTVASSRASLDAAADSIEPLNASYDLSIDSLRPAVFLKGRPADEVINKLTVAGTAQGNPRAPAINARIQSADGLFAAIRYSNLDVTAAYADGRVSATPLRVDAFKGTVVANANATLGDRPRFGIGLNLNNIDIEQALRSQKISAANWVHGYLSGDFTATGSGRKWPEIQPTLSGNGAMSLANGKLVGVNIVALAINGITSVPGVSQVVNATFRSNHSGLLADPNTELKNASMTFVLSGPRITTHDLTVQSPDYGITGDGWFDMSKNIDMDSDIKLTVGLSFAIPVWVKGKLPAVIVLPNVPKLTERLAMGAISAPGRIIRGGVSAVGSIFGGGSSNSSGSSGSSSGSSNPLSAFKSLLP